MICSVFDKWIDRGEYRLGVRPDQQYTRWLYTFWWYICSNDNLRFIVWHSIQYKRHRCISYQSMNIWYQATRKIIIYPIVMRFWITNQIVSWGCLLMLNILSHLLPLHNLTVNLTLREINASTYEWHTACPFGLRVFDLPPLTDTTYTHKDLRWSFFVYIYIYDYVKYIFI